MNDFSVSPMDYDLLERSWNKHHKGYWRRRLSRKEGFKTVFLHRIIGLRIAQRPLGRDELIDHINGDTSDNRRENLRIVTYSGNSQNARNHKFRGTTLHKQTGKWQASVHFANRAHYCGLFDNRETAALAAASKRKELGFMDGSEIKRP